MRYKGVEKSLSEIAEELNVDAVVEGTVYQIDESVRIRLQLVDVFPVERNLWSETYDRAMADVLMMYSEMAHAIAGKIQVKLTAEEETSFRSTRSIGPETYAAYLKGQFHWYKLTRKDLETALQYFQLALDKDPDNALAYAGIANVWSGQMAMGFVPTREAAPKAKAAAAKALELDDTLAEVHYALAFVGWIEWDWDGTWTAFRRAIELKPNYASARAYYSGFLHIMRRPEEAMAQIESALNLDPFNPLFQALYSMDLMYARRYDEAIELLRNTLKTAPNDLVSLSSLRSAYHMKHMYEEAMEIWKASYAAKNDREAEDALARGYAEAGYSGALSRVAETLIARSRTTYVTSWQIGTLYTRAGKNEKALEWLEKAYEEHDSNMPYLSVDPIFDGLRSDQRFQDLLRKMDLLELEK
jgi:tetratricopeptide (TPR) repeat protein